MFTLSAAPYGLLCALLSFAPGLTAQVAPSGQLAGQTRPVPVDVVGHFLDDVDDGLNDTTWYVARMLDMSQELLRLSTDDDSASRLFAANTSAHLEAFGELYVDGSSGILSTQAMLPEVLTLSGTSGTLSELQTWPVSLTDLHNVPQMPPGAASIAIYTGRFGSGPETIGFIGEFDLDAMGLFGCAGTPGCKFVVVVPYDIITEGGPITAFQAGEYFARLLNGSFDEPGALFAWLESQVGAQMAATLGSGGGSGGCDTAALADCLADVEAKFQADMKAIRDGVGQAISDLEGELVDAGKGALAWAGGGFVAGGITGGVTGASGGPLAAAAGAAIGAIAGTVGGLIGWAFSTDTDSIVADLEQARADAQAQKCAALAAARAAAEQCANEHCPEAREALVNHMDMLLYLQGC